MKYTVLWTPAAEQHLAAVWLDARDRSAITSAAGSIDDMLSEDAHCRGESRESTVRVTFVPPLGVEFDVLDQDRIVYVLAVWSFDTDSHGY